MKQFTKADLKPNMIVKLRRGDYAMIYSFNGSLVLVGDDRWSKLSGYDDNLLSLIIDFNDIVEVKEVTHEYQFSPNRWHDAPTIWERKEMPKLTEAEKGILENVLIDGEAPKWIARDEIGHKLCIFGGDKAPNKYDGFWAESRGKSSFLNGFTHLFEFVKWEDNEPCYIPDLLKGEAE